jgi:D-arabinitol 4-dehydrogenase
VLPALFFIFMRCWHRGELPYDYQDGILDPAATHAMFNAADPIAVYAHDAKLFGPLASKREFEHLLRETIVRLDSWVTATAPLAASH